MHFNTLLPAIINKLEILNRTNNLTVSIYMFQKIQIKLLTEQSKNGQRTISPVVYNYIPLHEAL